MPERMTDHCPACTIAADLTAHRDATAPEWSARRATLSFAVIVARRACPEYVAADLAPGPAQPSPPPESSHDPRGYERKGRP